MVGMASDGGHPPRQRRGQQLEHDARTRPPPRSALASATSRSAAGLLAALHPVAAERVHRLRREPEVAHHRNPAIHQRPHRLGHGPAALELDALGAGLLQYAPGVPDRLGHRDLIGEERQVHQHERARRAAADRGRVVDHLVERGAQRGLLAGDAPG